LNRLRIHVDIGHVARIKSNGSRDVTLLVEAAHALRPDVCTGNVGDVALNGASLLTARVHGDILSGSRHVVDSRLEARDDVILYAGDVVSQRDIDQSPLFGTDVVVEIFLPLKEGNVCGSLKPLEDYLLSPTENVGPGINEGGKCVVCNS
jgi:hypothetical protein